MDPIDPDVHGVRGLVLDSVTRFALSGSRRWRGHYRLDSRPPLRILVAQLPGLRSCVKHVRGERSVSPKPLLGTSVRYEFVRAARSCSTPLSSPQSAPQRVQRIPRSERVDRPARFLAIVNIWLNELRQALGSQWPNAVIENGADNGNSHIEGHARRNVRKWEAR